MCLHSLFFFFASPAPATNNCTLIFQAQGLCICCSFDHMSIWHLPLSSSVLLNCYSLGESSPNFAFSKHKLTPHALSSSRLLCLFLVHASPSDRFPYLFYTLLHHWKVCSRRTKNSVCFTPQCSVCWEVTAWRTGRGLVDLYSCIKEQMPEWTAQLCWGRLTWLVDAAGWCHSC